MKKTKKILSILLACMMLMSLLSVGTFAEDYIDANAKWFGYGVDCYLLNPTISDGDTDGVWYQLNVEQDGILFLEHRQKDVDYTVSISVNGVTYEGGYNDEVLYNSPLATLPVEAGDVAIIHVATEDAAAGTVYASMKVITGDASDSVKVKSAGIQVYVGAGQTVYYQDDSLNAVYAASGVLVSGDVADTVFYTVTKNAETGATSEVAYTDSDADGVIETKLGGSLGSAGAPPVKPAWAIENNSAVDQIYTIALADDAHECNWDDNTDLDCNTCGAIRDLPCQHVYDHDFDDSCNLCGEQRKTQALPLSIVGNSISPDVDGLAWLVDAKVEGIQLTNKTTAHYDNATVGGYKLVKMGAVLSNTNTEARLDDVDNYHVIDVPVLYICDTNEEAGTVSFSIRATEIPDEYKDHEIDIVTYVIFEDEAGVQHTLYGASASAAYNWFA